MLISQKYNSVHDIDIEFVPSLEELLAEYIPNFEFLKQHEKEAPESTSFTYILFFGKETNAPIGFAQLEIKNLPSPHKFRFSYLLKPKQKSLLNSPYQSVCWNIPGTLNEGIVFNPKYKNHAAQAAKKIFSEYITRKEVVSQSLKCSSAIEGFQDSFNDKNIKNKEIVTIDTLIKNKDSYQDFFFSLSNKKQIEIKKNWKEIKSTYKLQIGEYTNLKDLFSYKEEGAKQYKQFKSLPIYSQYPAENISYISLENSRKVSSIVLFIKGNGIHSFYDFYLFDDYIPHSIIHQQAIMCFFEKEQCNRLHCLNSDITNQSLLEIGYTYRKQFIIEATKN